MLVPNFQFNQNSDLNTSKHLIGYPSFPFGHNNWSPFTRCKPKGIVVKSIQFGQLSESTEYLRANKHNSRACQQSPVEEPPNQPKKPRLRSRRPENRIGSRHKIHRHHRVVRRSRSRPMNPAGRQSRSRRPENRIGSHRESRR
jgi:hypothetical protein